MRTSQVNWKYGRNRYQKYYEAKIDDDYLCVFCCEWSPDVWTAIVNGRMIHNKTKNDRQRKKQGLPKTAHTSELYVDHLLTGSPNYLMKKAERCYRRGIDEISE